MVLRNRASGNAAHPAWLILRPAKSASRPSQVIRRVRCRKAMASSPAETTAAAAVIPNT